MKEWVCHTVLNQKRQRPNLIKREKSHYNHFSTQQTSCIPLINIYLFYFIWRFVVRWLNTQREKINSSELSEQEIKVHWDLLVTTMFSHIRYVYYMLLFLLTRSVVVQGHKCMTVNSDRLWGWISTRRN